VTEKKDSLLLQLPQGRGFQFIHRLTQLTDNREVTAEFDYHGNEVILSADHFPGNIIFPGVHLQEGMNQTVTQLAQKEPQMKGRNFFLTGINTKFRRAVEPPATIVYTGRLTHLSPGRGGIAEVKAEVDGKLVAESEIHFIIMK